MSRENHGRPPLRVAVAQPSCAADDLEANVRAHSDVIAEAGARVVVFPELSLTGYDLTAKAVSATDERLSPLVAACAKADAVALVGAPTSDESGDRIATLAVTSAGVSVAYRKIYLHPPEPDRFTPGCAPVVIDVDGWRLGLAICRDTGVPQHVVDTVALGIDAYVAGTLFTPDEAAERDRRMSSIAHAHDVWVLLSACAADTRDFGPTSGGSAVWAPGGRIITQAGTSPGEVAVATLRAD